jgi:hypothetical protein
MTTHTLIAILVPVSFAIGLRVWKVGYSEAFRYTSLFNTCVLVIAIIAISAVLALILTQFYRMLTVRVTEETLEGRNHWGLKKRIPLNAVESLSRFSCPGGAMIVASSRHYGSIYISVHTERLEELMEHIVSYLPKNS